VEQDRIGARTDTLEVPSLLPDVAEMQLAELLSRDDSVLQNALRRILSESDTHDIVAGFNAAI
jgi:FXSXX-COOH protein